MESSSNSRRLRFAHDLRQPFRPLFGPVRPQIIFPDKFQALLTSRHRRTRIFAPALYPGDSWKFWPTLAGAVAIGVIAGKEIGTAVAGRDTDSAQ